MNLMMKTDWQGMSAESKLEYLQKNELHLQHQSMMNPLAKSTDPNDVKVRTYYRALCGGVILTCWFRSEQMAMEAGVDLLAATLQTLKVEENNQTQNGTV